MKTSSGRRNLRGAARAAALAALLAAGMGGSCKEERPPPVRPATTPTSLPASRPVDAGASRKLEQLEQQGLKAIADRRHGLLLKAVEALEQLAFQSRRNALRRDGLVQEFRRQAATIRDALHRFIFAELERLPANRRNELLAAADRGDADALERSGQALADHFFNAAQPHLRATGALRTGTIDPATGLPVRYAGRGKSQWKKRFVEAFNARMRALRAKTRPAK